MGFGAAYKHLTDDYEITAAAALFLYMGVANGTPSSSEKLTLELTKDISLNSTVVYTYTLYRHHQRLVLPSERNVGARKRRKDWENTAVVSRSLVWFPPADTALHLCAPLRIGSSFHGNSGKFVGFTYAA